MRLARLGLLGGLFLLPVRPAAAEVIVAVTDGRVDLTANSAPLSEVLDRLARQTRMELTYDGAPPRTLVTVVLQAATPAQAVLSVMEGLGVNYALQLDRSGRGVKSLLLIAGGASGPARAASGPDRPAGRVPPPPPPPAAVDYMEDEADEVEDEPPVEMRPDRPGRMGRPNRGERPDRPGVFEPGVPPNTGPFPPLAPAATPAYPVSPFAPVPNLPQVVVPPPGQAGQQVPPPENDPDS
jgi:hypothetical protein